MITVNGVTIGPAAVAREMQHHPASSREEAEARAARALVVRELLLQRAAGLGIDDEDEEGRIATLLVAEVRVPEPTAEEIARYYRRNGLKFMTPALFEAAHIFFPARAGDEDARAQAKAKAEAVLEQLLGEPARFPELAMAHSACSSKEQGGFLGQVSRGDTNPELEKALAAMEPGTIASEPVASRHGYHVVRLDKRASAQQLPLERVESWIADHLRESAERRATAQYLMLLAGQARIDGIDFAAADSPLVQ
ncbi:MAG: peptidylprolyl isomerase [Alphaproteobacteria bacterium]